MPARGTRRTDASLGPPTTTPNPNYGRGRRPLLSQ